MSLLIETHIAQPSDYPCTHNRDNSIDIAKGIAILLVIIGHLDIPFLTGFIFSFHMPIFFIISGMLFKDKDHLIKNKFLKYVKPYLFSIIGLIVVKLLFNILIQRDSTLLIHSVFRWFKAGIWGSMFNNLLGFSLPTVGMIWFFWALFWTQLFNHYIIKIQNNLLQFVIVSSLLVFSLFSSKYTGLPFSIQSACSCYLFLFVGYNLKAGFFKSNLVLIVLCCIIWAIDLYYTAIDTYPNFGLCRFPDELINYSGAIAASYLILSLSRLIDKFKILNVVLSFFGRYSVVVLCFHFIEQITFPWGAIIIHLSEYLNFGMSVMIVIIIKMIIAFLSVKFVLHIQPLKQLFSLK